MYKIITKMLLPLLLTCLFFHSVGAQDQTVPSLWFDSYRVIPWNEEKGHLDNFAHHLKQNPDQIGYLIYFADEYLPRSNAARKSQRARNFLLRVRGIKPGRIVIIYGGKRGEAKFVLQPISKDLPPPRFSKNQKGPTRWKDVQQHFDALWH